LLSVEFSNPDALPAIDDIDRAAAYLATCVEYERERNALSHQSRQMEALMSVLRQLPAEIELQPLGHRLADAALHLAGADGVVVLVWENESGRVVGVAGVQAVAQDTPVSGQESETALAARSAAMIQRQPREGMPVICKDETFSTPPHELVALPLISKENVVGVVTIWSAGSQLDSAGLEAMQALAPYAALHFEHARAYGLLRERADRDPLTGLLNRQAFDAQLAAESARFHRYQRPYAVLLIDVDHFKSVNDQWGHQTGDAVLANVGLVLAGTLRESDQAARYGGEEFAILLPETDLAQALEIGERVRGKLAAAESAGPGGRIAITASTGAASCPQCARDPESLLHAADAALYRAKAEGRNRVVAAVAHRAAPPPRSVDLK
jgi:diguanylate cyclase (GGDEF)-like protein